LGYAEGQSIIVEYRFGQGSEDHLKDRATELARLRMDVIVALGPPAMHALLATGTTIPIVAATGDLVADGFVPSMPHPGGTITGISLMQGPMGANLTGKRLQLVKEAMPALTKVGFLFNPKLPRNLSQVELAAQTLDLHIFSVPAQLIEEVKPAIAGFKRDGAEAIIVDASPPFIAYQPEIVELALDLRLPTVSEQPEFAEDGGLLSYGMSIFSVEQRLAYYVDRILKGAKPADLPVEYPTKFELVINLKTAKALGLTVPESLLLQADKVIE